MSASQANRIEVVFRALFLLCALTAVAVIALNHWKIISHELPLDYNEAGMLVITSTIAEGGNPFDIENQPTRMSLYPVSYNVLTAQVSRVTSNTLQVHRLVTAFFIISSCALCFLACRKAKATKTDSLLGATILYAGLLYYSTPIASPSSLGLFLFLLALIIPWVRNFSTPSLLTSIALGSVAFLTKQYYLACLGYIALYMFIAISKQRAIYFGLAVTAALIAIVALLYTTSPYYFDNTFFAPSSSFDLIASQAIVYSQIAEFSVVYAPLLIVLAVGTALHLRSAPTQARVVPEKALGALNPTRWNYLDFDRPLLDMKPDYIWFCCLCSVVVIVLVLGKNPGNHLTYFFQLISPFLLAGIFGLMSSAGKWAWVFRIFALIALYNTYALLPTDFSVKEKGWIKVRSEIANAEDIYASTLVLAEVLKRDSPIYLNGHTRYFPFGAIKPQLFSRANKEHSVNHLWGNHVSRFERKIVNQEFDLLLIDHWMHLPHLPEDSSDRVEALLNRHYEKTDSFPLTLPDRPGGGSYRMDIWKPRPPSPN